MSSSRRRGSGRRVVVAPTPSSHSPTQTSPVVLPATSVAESPASGEFSANQLSMLQTLIVSTVQSTMQAMAAPATSEPATVTRGAVAQEVDSGFAHLTQLTIDKILRGEYVEFSSLLPPTTSVCMDTETSAKRFCITEDEGQLVLSAATSTKQKVDSLATWLEAWSVYCSIILSNSNDRAAELMAFQLRILQAAKRYKWHAVMEYDVLFRQKAARHLAMRWDAVDNDLYSRCFTGQAIPFCLACKRPGHHTSSCVSKDGKQQQHEKEGRAPVCDGYNSGNCPFRHCRFRHICRTCGAADHGASRCHGKPPQ